MRRERLLGPIVTAFRFLTRLPLGDGGDDATDLGVAVAWFPLVGLVVGALVGAVHLGLEPSIGSLPSAAVAVSVGLLVTGAFHEDGLGDTADGFGGGWTPARRLEIMADPRQGTYGVAAICASIVVRVALISALVSVDGFVVIAVAHLLARTVAALALGLARPARADGLARSARSGSPLAAVAVATAWSAAAAIGVAVAVGWLAAALVLATAAAVALATVALAYRKIGGVSGDVLGAIEQLVEVGVLLAGAAML